MTQFSYMNWASFLGFGTAPINITVLTRGQDAGIYFTPTLNGSVGNGAELSLGITFSRGWFTGNPQSIKASDLVGHTLGASTGIGLGPHGSAGLSYSWGDGYGFINVGAQVGAGVEISPITGVNIQGNYQYAPIAIPIFKF